MDDDRSPMTRAREEAGVSLSDMANLSGIPRTTLRRKEAHPSQFTFGELNAIARVLDLGVDELVEGLVDDLR